MPHRWHQSAANHAPRRWRPTTPAAPPSPDHRSARLAHASRYALSRRPVAQPVPASRQMRRRWQATDRPAPTAPWRPHPDNVRAARQYRCRHGRPGRETASGASRHPHPSTSEFQALRRARQTQTPGNRVAVRGRCAPPPAPPPWPPPRRHPAWSRRCRRK